MMMSIAPRPSTAITAPTAAEGFRSASQRFALGEVPLIIGDDLIDRCLRHAGKALAQTLDESGAAHVMSPRMSLTAAAKAAHSCFCEAKLLRPAGGSREYLRGGRPS